MKMTLRILVVEDSEDDALLTLYQIKKGGYGIEYERVETAEGMKAALKEKKWDLVLSDYKMPRFNGIQALALLKESGLDIPFIIISGTIGEEVAVEAMKTGAQDYIMKSNLQRLLPAIERELHELEIRAERKHLEQKQKQSEQERLAHLRYFECMDKINQAIQGSDQFDDMLSDVLDVVLEIFNCDRVFLLYPCDPEASSWKIPMERNNPEYPKIPILGEVPMDAKVAEMLRILLYTNGPVKFGPKSKYKLQTDLAIHIGVKSFVSTTLHPKIGKPWLFNIQQCSYPRVWSPEEEKLFQEISRRLSDALTSLLTNRELRESENRYRRIAEGLTDYQYSVTIENGHAVKTIQSQACATITGYKPEEFVTDPYLWIKMVAPDDRDLVRERVKQILAGMDIPPIEHRIVRKDGALRWVCDTTILLKDASGQLVSYDGVIKDITERKQAEETIRKNECRYRSLFEDSAIPIVEEDFSQVKIYFDQLRTAGVKEWQTHFESHSDDVRKCAALANIVDGNKESLRFFQVNSKDELAKSFTSYFVDEGWSVFTDELIALAEGKDRFESEITIRTLDGKHKKLLLIISVSSEFRETLARVMVSFVYTTDWSFQSINSHIELEA